MTLELTVKVTLILCTVAIAGVLLRRRSAAARHLVQVLGLGAALALPLLALALPAWELPLLEAVALEEASFPGYRSIPSHDPVDSRGTHWAAKKARAERSTPGLPVQTATAPPLAGDGDEGGLDVAWLPLLWALGAAIVLGRLAFGWLQINRLAIDARPLSCERNGWIVDDCVERLGIRRSPRVLLSDDIEMPMLWGFIRPILLLPSSAANWPTSRLRAVLLHELAHLRRRDGAALLIGRLAAAAWWFHPVVWMLERRARCDCERACDDVVLTTGERPSSYARHLLEIAQGLPGTPAPGGVLTLVGRGQLEGRLHAILQPRVRRGLGRRGGMTMLALVVVGLVSVSSVKLVARPADGSADTLRTLAIDRSERPVGETRDVKWRVASRMQSEANDDGIMLAHDGGHGEGEAIYERAYDAHQEERFAEAAADFEAAAEAGYRPGTALYNAACGHARMGEVDRAVELVQRAIAAGFGNAGLLMSDSDFDPVRREPAFREMIQRISDDRKLGRLGRTDRHGMLVEQYDELLAERSDSGKAWYEIGSALLGFRDFERATDALERAAETLGYRNEVALYNLACAHSLEGSERDALDYLEQAVLAGFDSKERFRNDSDLDNIRDSGRFESIEDLHDMLSLDRFHWGRSGADYSTRRWEPAVEEFGQFVQSNPGIGRAWHNLGWALHFSRRHAEARDAFQKQLDLGFRAPQATYNIACTYAKEGDTDQALNWLSRAIDDDSFGVGQLIHDDDLRSLHDDPRFEALIEKAACDGHSDCDYDRSRMFKRWKLKKEKAKIVEKMKKIERASLY